MTAGGLGGEYVRGVAARDVPAATGDHADTMKDLLARLNIGDNDRDVTPAERRDRPLRLLRRSTLMAIPVHPHRAGMHSVPSEQVRGEPQRYQRPERLQARRRGG